MTNIIFPLPKRQNLPVCSKQRDLRQIQCARIQSYYIRFTRTFSISAERLSQ